MKKVFLSMIAVILLLALAACSVTPTAAPDATPTPTATPAPASEPSPTPRPYDYSEEELAILALADNTTPRDQLVKTVYSQAKLHDLRYYLSNARRKLTELNKAFPIECLRQTEEGYYAVYLGEDGKTAFAFLEEDPLYIREFLVLEPLVTKQEFLDFLSQGVTRNEILAADPNTIVYINGSIVIRDTKHLVQGGAFYLSYTEHSVAETKNKFDNVMSSWEYLSEEDLLLESRDHGSANNVALITGYILPMDKELLPGQESGHLREGALPYPEETEALLVQQADNKTSCQKLLTRIYSEEEIHKMVRLITGKPDAPEFSQGEEWLLHTQQLQELYPVECLRELPGRLYAVYQCENGKKAFVFLDRTVSYSCYPRLEEQITVEGWNLYVSDCKIMGPFHTRQEFDAFLAQSPTLGEIQAFDPDGNTYSTNVQAITSHNVKEGVYVLTFNFQQGATDPSQWVLDPEKTKFYTNEEVETQRITPYAPHALLGIDKAD